MAVPHEDSGLQQIRGGAAAFRRAGALGSPRLHLSPVTWRMHVLHYLHGSGGI